MRHPDRRPVTPVALAGSDSAGSPWPGLRLWDVLTRLLVAARSGRGTRTAALGAGYALRRRQEANLQRLACPACRPPRWGDADPDSGGITASTSANGHGTGSDMTYGLVPDAVRRPGRLEPETTIVGAGGREPLERAHGT
jgi:hypothetical protein